jgi:hypothetical protein
MNATADLNVVSFRPRRDDYAWTFGGAEPVMKADVYASAHSRLTEIAARYLQERGSR